jgi:ectoine hydroxylase-related dioxygenase (phytanoyl-CoA dioxygenase family)
MDNLPKPTIHLTPQQIDFYQEHGYLAIDVLTTQDEVATMRVIYDRLFQTQAGREEGNQFDLAGTDEDGKEAALPQILGPAKYAPELQNLLARANALQIARQLLGPNATWSGDHAIFKPARSGAPTPWHQDEAYWNPQVDYNALSIWMPLQEATLENGCMQFIPGSHKHDVVPHRPINNDPRIHGLELSEEAGVDISTPAICPLPPGGATLHSSRTLHYTAPNLSDVPRRAYIMTFGTSTVARKSERRFPWNEAKITARQERARIAASSKTDADV